MTKNCDTCKFYKVNLENWPCKYCGDTNRWTEKGSDMNFDEWWDKEITSEDDESVLSPMEYARTIWDAAIKETRPEPLKKAQNRAKQGEIAYAHLRKVIDALEKDNAAKQAELSFAKTQLEDSRAYVTRLKEDLENVLEHERDVCIKANDYRVALDSIAKFTIDDNTYPASYLQNIAKAAIEI